MTNDIFVDDNNQNNPIVHIRVFQRTSRTFITTIEGLPQYSNFKLYLKQMKTKFHCNGSIKNKGDTGEILIQLSGDQRNDVTNYLVKNNICSKECIKIHGC